MSTEVRVPREAGVRFPGAGVTGACKAPEVGRGRAESLEEQ